MVRVPFLLVCLALVLVVACRPEPTPVTNLPTIIPTADLILTATPNLPVTSQLHPAGTTTPTIPTPTRRPTETPPPVQAVINITTPSDGAEVVLGRELFVGGLLRRNPGQTVAVGLVSITGRVLTTTIATVDDTTNSWQTTLIVPSTISGAGQLQAAILNSDGSVAAITNSPVTLAIDSTTSESYLAIFRPVISENGVSGHNLFFDGRLQKQGGGYLNLSIWVDNCQRQVAQHGFQLRGSSYWQGFVIVPHDLSGPACAVASIGSPDSPDWRQAEIPINILAREDPAAHGLVIGNPPAGQTYLTGNPLYVYGVAYNAPDSQVRVSIVLENGRILSETTVAADFWGYWEAQVILPFDGDGQAAIAVSTGDIDQPEDQTQVIITIEPAPTPTRPPLPSPTSPPTPTPTP